MPAPSTPARRRALHLVGHALERSQTFVQRRLIGDRYENTLLTWGLVEGGLEVPCPVRVIWPGETVAWAKKLPRVAAAARHASVVAVMTQERPNVVHAHFGSAGAGIVSECRLLGVPLVTSFYGFDVGTMPLERRGMRKLRALFAYASALTAEGPALARRLVELGARPSSVKLLPLCLPDWCQAEPKRTLDFHAPELRLLQVARFVDKKGIDTALRAMAKARARGVPVTLSLIGDGSLRGELEQLAAELGLGASVSWLGFRPYHELPEFLAASHLLIQPSRTAKNGDTEGGHPTTIIEALAQGVPVVGTRHADIPFAVRDGETGLLCAEEDVDALAAALETLHRDRDRLVRMSSVARRRTLVRHDPERLRRLRERIYREAARRRP
jgi:colanic acid/amylovoran biosynthesis glycosyltransferase